MARAKKEAALTPEERLQAALVPDWEWPYKLPKNWCWTTVGAINQYVGISADPTKAKNKTFELYSVPSSADNYPEIVLGADIGSTKQSVKKGDVLLCKINPRINRVWKVSKYTDHSLLASSEWIVIRNSGLISNYLMWCFRSPYFRGYMLSNVSGVGGSLMRAQPKFVQGYPVPVPPLAEQQRIVDRIESLFAKLDEAKEKAQAVVDSFETRKAAILHKAFTGELTAKWREEHGVGMESWHLRTIGEVCENVKVGIVIKPSQYYVPQNEGTPAFRSANVRECRIDDFDWVYLNEKGMKDNSRSIVHTGDVLVVRSGNPGTACVVPERFDGYNAIDILIAVPNKKIIISDYLCYYTNSPLGKKTVEIGKRGIALTHFNVKGFSQMPINIPTIPEQVVIVRTLGDLFAQEQQSKEAAEAVLDQIDLMKKSILARAFRGELGTNDPSEESAVELLKEIIRRG